MPARCWAASRKVSWKACAGALVAATACCGVVRGAADGRGVERFVAEVAAEEEKVAELDAGGVRGRAGDDLRRRRREGHRRVDRAAGGDGGALGDRLVGGHLVLARA